MEPDRTRRKGTAAFVFGNSREIAMRTSRSGLATGIVCAAIAIASGATPSRPGPNAPLQSPAPPGAPDRAEPDLAALRSKVVARHNQIRAEARLSSLAVSEKLQAAAELHARDMAARRTMTHKGSRGSTASDRIKAKGYSYRRAGENIAVGYDDVDRLMKGWMDSPPHKRNILGGFSQIGVGCAIAEDGKRYWCVTFGLPIRR
jgi:uncharacterized protein YkwD